ncbi:hypothetical protein RHGRI_015080 [Rhododendron griersonianum]|uniref:Uncharacterized protein n=1 Tax=Rhododendron griersonianum TaxID=479676 RepID=A0AAV6KCI0_9ERIC|nr:hypothetical protein RHGRI_015080 [Rhododendron griersonianum]
MRDWRIETAALRFQERCDAIPFSTSPVFLSMKKTWYENFIASGEYPSSQNVLDTVLLTYVASSNTVNGEEPLVPVVCRCCFVLRVVVSGNVELFLVPSGCILFSACSPFIIDEPFLFNLLEIQIVGHSLFSSFNINALRLGSQSTSPEITCSSILSQQQRTFIQMRTKLKVVDNSGAKQIMCLQALKGKKGGKWGHCDGSEVKFDDNAAVLVNKQGEPIGTRVFGPVPHELRKKKHVKILSLAEHITQPYKLLLCGIMIYVIYMVFDACFPFIIDEPFLFNLLGIQIVGHSLFSSLNINALRLGAQSTSPEITCSSILSQQQRTFIQMRTKLKVVDNSGAKEIMCIQALKGGKNGARLGDLIVASMKEFQPAGKTKKGAVVYAIVRAAMQRGRCDGSEVKFDDNAVVLVNKQAEHCFKDKVPKTCTSAVMEGHECLDPTSSGDHFVSFTYEAATAITDDGFGASYVHTSVVPRLTNCGLVGLWSRVLFVCRISTLNQEELAQLQEELKKAKDQLSSSESYKKRAEEEAEEAKKQLAATSAMLKDSQQQLMELSDSDDARVRELHKISQERDQAWQSKLKAVQKQHSMDSAALGSAMESAHAEIQNARLELEETLSLVEHLKAQLSDCKESETQALAFVSETQMKLERAKETEKMLRSKGLNAMETCKLMAVELEQSKDRGNMLEEHVGELQANSESRYQEEYIQSTLEIRSAYELAEHTKLEASQKEAELDSKLMKATKEIEELKADLVAKETKLQSIFKENEGLSGDIEKNMWGECESLLEMEKKKFEVGLADLKASLLDKENELQSIKEENESMKFEIRKREVESNEAKDEALASAESAKAAEREALMKLGFLTEAADKSIRKVARVTEQLDASQAANAEMEAELRRLKVQSDQWRKAAEAAAAMLSTGNNNGKYVERTGSLDYHTIGGKLGSPFSEDLDDESPKKKNDGVFKKIEEVSFQSPSSFVNEDAPEAFIRGGATRENLAGSAPPLSGEPTGQRALAGSCANPRLANIGHFEPFRQLRFGEQTYRSSALMSMRLGCSVKKKGYGTQL